MKESKISDSSRNNIYFLLVLIVIHCLSASYILYFESIIYTYIYISVLITVIVGFRFLKIFGIGLLLSLNIFIAIKDFLNTKVIFELMEHGIRIAIPIVLIHYFIKNRLSLNILKLGVFFTFLGHGLYCLNIVPIPKMFYNLSYNILYINNENIEMFLLIVGILDIVTAILLFSKFSKFALIYMTIWGLLTAISRIIAFHDTDTLYWSFQSLIRLQNSFLPFFLLINFFRVKTF